MTLSAPFHADLKRMKRVTTKTSANAVHLAPLVAEWQGTGTPVLLFGGRRGQIMQLDVYDNPPAITTWRSPAPSVPANRCC